MDIQVIKPYKSLYTSNTRYYLLYGGRAGGRSYSASQKAIINTISKPYSRIAVMRYILGDIRSSIWQEIKDRIDDYGLPPVISDQAMRYIYPNGNSIDGKGFKASTGQNSAKLKSLAGYSTIIIEEADEITEDDFNNLDSSIRTNKGQNEIILMFNMPHRSHWIIRKWFNLTKSGIDGYYNAQPKTDNDTTYIQSTYHDNIINLPQSVIRTFENFKTYNPEYYYTMIQGLVSEGVRGRIFENWLPIPINEYNQLPYTPVYGLDFGFTNDPTALTEIKKHNNNIYAKELIYKTNLTNQDISDELNRLGVNGLIIADSAEPKSIEELRRLGHNIIPANKGVDSVRAGIQSLKSHQVYYTSDSPNISIEVQNYTYTTDRDKFFTNDPIDKYNHAMDSIRYALTHITNKPKLEFNWI